MGVKHYELSRVIKELCAAGGSALAKLHHVSMQGVGTKLGTLFLGSVHSQPFDDVLQFVFFRVSSHDRVELSTSKNRRLVTRRGGESCDHA
jgi:hypothetical protein